MEQELILNASMIKRWMFAHVKSQNNILEVQKYIIFGLCNVRNAHVII